ncbi:hypothetical protein PEC302110_36320 [Pectobacterium araliae]|uniref:Uncharacterized protein n=1 Tax=Pectobacterium araliae TaxID=3073862 RepID=A0AAN0MN97_9GAMM|nr:hypothetical protein PEC302110_36320 [Pectobacterium sp. MAFF 302110]
MKTFQEGIKKRYVIRNNAENMAQWGNADRLRIEIPGATTVRGIPAGTSSPCFPRSPRLSE